MKGITVDTESLALEVIDTVGPGGNFITADHTMDHLHTEYFRGNSVTDQQGRDRWSEDGSPDARKRACDIVRKILAQKERSYIDPKVDQTIRKKYDILL